MKNVTFEGQTFCIEIHLMKEEFCVLEESSHLPLYRLITLLNKEQDNTFCQMKIRISGEAPKTSKLKQIKLNERLLNLVQMYKCSDQWVKLSETENANADTQ